MARPARDDERPGAFFFGDRLGRYAILDRLGAGGMGEVYRARDARSPTEVAIKVLRVDRDGAPHRLVREARAIAALDHPNVVKVLEVDEAVGPDGAPVTFLAMELVRGAPLRAHVGDASVPVERRIAWLVGVARGLAAAHARGVVHRDVKPENVVVGDDGEAKILDFGIAKLVRSGADACRTTTLPTLTETGVVVGTPLYMSPEQMRGEPVDGRSDQFAWGVMAYELLSGVAPWRRMGAVGTTATVLSSDPPPLRAHDRAILTRWEAAVMRALAKSPRRRFPSMEDAARALLGERSSQPATAHGGTLALGIAAASIAIGAAFVATRPSRVDSFASRRAASARAPASCKHANDCASARGGDAWTCRAGACIALASADCEVHAGPKDLASDDTVWLGAMLPLGDREAGWVHADARALELARRDFASTIGAVAGERGVGLVVCDDTRDAAESARHLVDDVRVPAVMGLRSADEITKLASTYFLPRRVLTLVTLNENAHVLDLPSPPGEPRLLWRTTIDLAATARPVARLVSDYVEPRVRAPMRVALVRERGRAPDFVEALFRTLSWGGKSLAEHGDDFREIVWSVDDASDAAASALAAFAPVVVVLVGRDEIAARVLAPAEARWPRASRPFVVTPGVLAPSVRGYAVSHGRGRFVGVTNVTRTSENARFVLHYNEAFPDTPTATTISPSNSYDAFYLLAYATYALAADVVTGPALARAMARLTPPGAPISVGPPGIFPAIRALREGGRVDLSGALGSLDLDDATGEAPIDYELLCVSASGDDDESGVTYDAARDRLRGELACAH